MASVYTFSSIFLAPFACFVGAAPALRGFWFLTSDLNQYESHQATESTKDGFNDFFVAFARSVGNTRWKNAVLNMLAFILFALTMKCDALKVASVYTFSSIILRALCVLRGKYSVEKRGFKHAGL